jgi:hypothetical protein
MCLYSVLNTLLPQGVDISEGIQPSYTYFTVTLCQVLHAETNIFFSIES